MKTIIIPLFLLLLFACNHQQAPTSFDCKCPNERVSFKKQDHFPLATFSPDSVSMPIELTEDSSFIGMWFHKNKQFSHIDLYYSINNKLYESGYNFFLFQIPEEKLKSPKYVREKKYST